MLPAYHHPISGNQPLLWWCGEAGLLFDPIDPKGEGGSHSSFRQVKEVDGLLLPGPGKSTILPIFMMDVKGHLFVSQA